MTAEQCEAAAEMVEALRRIGKLRKILASANKDHDWRLKLEAYDGDDDGGSIKGSLYIDRDHAEAALGPLEKYLTDKLAEIGVGTPTVTT